MKNHRVISLAVFAALALSRSTDAHAQALEESNAAPSYGSIATPRPVNPATGTTNPSARATQSLNPYLGSASEEPVVDAEIAISLQDAISRGEEHNLGLIDSQQADARTQADRERALSDLLPQISARAQQTYQQLSYESLGIKLPKSAGVNLPPTSGGFGYSEARVEVAAPVVNLRLLDKYRQAQTLVKASQLSTLDARDVVAFAVGAAYFQVVASVARLKSAQAALASAQELNHQVEDQYKSEVSPEIEALKARVELSTAEQRVVDAANDLEKDKLTLDRITGTPLAQRWTLSKDYGYQPLPDFSTARPATGEGRADLASAKGELAAAELGLRAAHAERLPEVSFSGNYGSGGTNPANYNQLYAVQGTISIPIFTSGRIRSDVYGAQAALVQRKAEYQDLKGRVDYDVRTAQLDVRSSNAAVKVALENQKLAAKALEQSQDRYKAGVTNYLEVLQAEEAQVAADENYVASLFSFNVSKLALARAQGSAESHLDSYFGSH